MTHAFVDGLDRFVLPNRVVFPQWIYETYKSIPDDESQSHFPLFQHQKFVREYMRFESPFRGLILYHGLGVGKTCGAIAVAELLHSRVRKVIVLTVASLQDSFKSEMTKCGRKSMIKMQRWRHDEVTGKYVVDARDGTPYERLESADKKALDRQILAMIASQYRFLNYNGVHTSHLIDLGPRFFDHSLIIIDEAHQFISRAMTPGHTGNLLYNILLDSVGSRVLMLTGTPIINHPFELSMMLNLAYGKKRIYEARLAKAVFDRSAAAKLEADPKVDEYTYNATDGMLQVAFLPQGYEFEDREKAHVRRVTGSSSTSSITSLRTCLGADVKVSERTVLQFPIEESVFNDTYIDGTGTLAKNKIQFVRRMQGLVSYFHKRDPKIYPSLVGEHIVQLRMSKTQFNVYSKARKEEIKRDQLSSRYADGRDNKVSSTYKAFSRAACNFAFPEDNVRPYPSKMTQFMDDNDDLSSKKNRYKLTLKASLEKLRASDALSPERLPEHSPKMACLIDKIRAANGTCLVYSQFKEAEGIAILAMAMEAAGFQRIVVDEPSDRGALVLHSSEEAGEEAGEEDATTIRFTIFDTEDRPKAELLKGVFNSDTSIVPKHIIGQIERACGTFDNVRGAVCKVILITASGAQGISLKNVRQVHLLEPYWNYVRIDQVVGRAIRANSHSSLPQSERTVEVFMYVMQIVDEQRDDFLLKSKDEGQTTDEIVMDIAERKRKLAKEFLDLMKAGAVDCVHHETDPASACFHHDARLRDAELAYPADLRRDKADAAYVSDVARLPVAAKIIAEVDREDGSTALLLDDAAQTLIDREIYKKLRRHVVVGHL
jgi:superfamily II DNA or RNA helicase